MRTAQLVFGIEKELCPEKSFGDIAKEAESSDYTEFFDPNDERFSAPKSMKAAIDSYFEERGLGAPKCERDYFNSAYLSLAGGYKTAINDLEKNTGRKYSYIYIVGGGAKNAYLNALTEKVTGKKVVALPIEATAIGNLKVQMERAE